MAEIVTSITLDDSGYQAGAKRIVGARQPAAAPTGHYCRQQVMVGAAD